MRIEYGFDAYPMPSADRPLSHTDPIVRFNSLKKGKIEIWLNKSHLYTFFTMDECKYTGRKSLKVILDVSNAIQQTSSAVHSSS